MTSGPIATAKLRTTHGVAFADLDNDGWLELILGTSKYALLGDYTKTPSLYRCPADRSTARFGGRSYPRVRSVSMNIYVGRIVECEGNEPVHVGPRTLCQIPNPALQFVFLDEHPDTIRSISFWLSRAKDHEAKFISYPGSLHNGGTTLSFADGHAEHHRWQDPRTRPPVTYRNSLPEADSPNNPHIDWLQQRTYFPRE